MILKRRKLILLAMAGSLAWCTAILSRPAQPVKFSHNKHIVDNGMECTDCHQYVTTSRKATLPGKDICLGCHSDPIGDSPEEQKLIEILESDQELSWQRVYVLPRHVYFSHFRHVTLGQISCENCHGEMKKLTSPPEKPAVDIINMSYCIDCHENKQVGNDCLKCHE